MAQDGQSHGPARGSPGQGVTSVVATLDYQTHLDNDQMELQLINNHTIRDLIIAHKDEMIKRGGLERRRESVLQQLAAPHFPLELASHLDAPLPDQIYEGVQAASESAEQRHTRLRRELEEIDAEIDQAEEDLENAIFQKLEHAENKLRDMAEMLGGNNPDAAARRAKIVELDAEIRSLEAQLEQIEAVNAEISRLLSVNGEGGRERLGQLVRGLDQSGMPPLESALDPQADYWERVSDRGRSTLEGHLSAKRSELIDRIKRIENEYPSEYKVYHRIINGYAPEEEQINWWAISMDIAKWVVTEAAWIAAGVVAGALTAGIGSAIVASARMARVAARVGNAVGAARRAALSTAAGRGVAAVVKLVDWMNSIPDRILLGVYARFGNAARRLRGGSRRDIRQGADGGDVHDRSPGVVGRNCAIGRC